MIDLFMQYGMFLLKALTVLIVVGLIISMIAAAQTKKNQAEGKLNIKHLNQRMEDITLQLKQSVLEKSELKALLKQKKQQQKAEKKRKKKKNQAEQTQDKHDTKEQAVHASSAEPAGVDPTDQTTKETARHKTVPARAWVLEFKGDIRASQTEQLREEITAILSMASRQDEVIIKLDSSGGMVHGYGLAAAQLVRLRNKGIPLTVCIDKVAASGGYMMAAVADQIIAAPFAIIGSIGVVAQIPNFHRFLQNRKIDVDVLTAGKHKRTLTIFGKNTEEGKKKFIHDLEDTHGLFKQFVQQNRPQLMIDEVADGDIWYGQRALDKKLIDRIQTSDDYLMELYQTKAVYQVQYQKKKNLAEKLGKTSAAIADQVVIRLIDQWERLKY